MGSCARVCFDADKTDVFFMQFGPLYMACQSIFLNEFSFAQETQPSLFLVATRHCRVVVQEIQGRRVLAPHLVPIGIFLLPGCP